jgi:arylsulfatase/arylsulfatase A
MTDDQGYGDFGATGNRVFQTPNIDLLASRSASMSTFYVSPVCSPTRACLMTGRYNYRTRCIDTWVGRSMLEPDEVTVAEVLAAAGYTTGIFGKWHLGDCFPMRPMDQGFDESLVHRGGGLAQPSEPRENDRRYTDPILFHNGRQVQTEGYCTDVYFDAAINFIETAHRERRNFFVYVPTNAPHDPFHDVPEELRERYMQERERLRTLMKDEPSSVESAVDTLARIAAMITNVDQNVGRLVNRLAELKLAENTLVIYLVDNGPNTMRYVGPFRGMKTNVHEGGIRSPLWLCWPARLKAGHTRDELCAHVDLMPTILEACGVRPPGGVRLDGRSLLPLLEDKVTDWPERTIAIQSHRGDQPTRYHHFMIRDSRWKLLHPSGFGREHFEGEPNFELYDLQGDPGETKNLIAQKPDVFRRLKDSYDAWFDDVSSTRPDNYDPPRIHVGSPHEPITVLTRQDWRGGSWSRDAIGHWRIHVAADGRYDFDIGLEPQKEETSLALTAGTITRRLPVAGSAGTVQVTGVELPSGDSDLQVVIYGGSDGGKTRGAYQVSVGLSP